MQVILVVALSLLFGSCSSPGGTYYGYAHDYTSEPILNGLAKSPKYSVSLPVHIKDPAGVERLVLDVGFSGEHQFYPRGLRFEVYEDGKLLSAETPQLTITTVLDGRVSRFPVRDETTDIASLVKRVKSEKKMPDDTVYFVVSGIIKFPLASPGCPEKVKLILKVFWEGGATQRELLFVLTKREYAKPSSRPFG